MAAVQVFSVGTESGDLQGHAAQQYRNGAVADAGIDHPLIMKAGVSLLGSAGYTDVVIVRLHALQHIPYASADRIGFIAHGIQAHDGQQYGYGQVKQHRLAFFRFCLSGII